MPPKNNAGKLSKFWKKYKKSFHWKLATFLILLGIIIVFIYFKFPEFEKSLTFITAIIVAFSGVFSAIYVGKGLSNRIHFDKVKNSFEFNNYFNSHEYNGLKEICKEEYDARNHSPNDLVQKVKNDEDLFYKLKSILNKFEDMSLAIQRNYVDEKILYWSLDLIVDFYISNFKSYIDDCIKDNPETYMELLKLHECWSKRIYLLTGKSVDDDVDDFSSE